MNLKASKEFVVGKNSISYVGSTFKKVFADLTFTPGTSDLRAKTLEKPMLDSEIFAQWQPQAVTLGDVLAFLRGADKSGWYICYVNDSKGTLWTVDAGWYDGGWNVYAYSVDDPLRWLEGSQVVSRGFLDPQPQTLDALALCPRCHKEITIKLT